jgi:hypothetical protein
MTTTRARVAPTSPHGTAPTGRTYPYLAGAAQVGRVQGMARRARALTRRHPPGAAAIAPAFR